MRKIITKGYKWSKFVDKLWRAQSADVDQYNAIIVLTDDESRQHWQCTRYDGSGGEHNITLPALGTTEIPTCDCATFTSTLIPCRGIYCVYGRIEPTLFA